MSHCPRISVIVPNYNGEVFVRPLLEALRSQDIDVKEFELVLVDNGSSDGSVGLINELAASLPFKIKLASLPFPRSSYACRNFGASLANHEVLAFTDIDCQPEPGWLSSIQNYFALGAQREGRLLAGAVEIFPKHSQFNSAEWFDKCNFLRQQQSCAKQAALTANLALTTGDFQRLSGFKEVTSSGDVEFTRRAIANGLALEFRDNVRVLHPARDNLQALKEKMARIAKGQVQLNYHGKSFAVKTGFIMKHLAAMLICPIFWRTIYRSLLAKQFRLLFASTLVPLSIFLEQFYRITSIAEAVRIKATAQKPRIAMILSRLKRGGGVRSQLTLANLMYERGFQIEILVHRACNFGPSLPVKANIKEVGLNVKNAYVSYLINTFFILLAVRKYDLVISIFAPEYPLIRLASLFGGPRVVHFARHYDPILLDSSKVSSPLLLWLYGLIAKYSHLAFSEMLVNSHWTGEKICSELGKPIPYQVIPNGVDRTTFKQVIYKSAPNLEKLTFLVVGKPQKYKGLDDVLQALQLFRRSGGIPFRLVIMTTDLLEIKTKYDFGIEIRHPTNDQELVDLYNQADVMLSASWLEGFCNPPLEAMACGTPAVVTACGGIAEYARDGVNCLIAPIKSPAVFAEKISELLFTPGLYSSLVAAGLKTSHEFSWESSADKLEAVINR